MAKNSHHVAEIAVDADSDRQQPKGDADLRPLASCQQTLLAQHTFLRV